MRKQSWTAHPIVHVLIGLGIGALYTTFEHAVSPHARLLLGDWWPRLKPLFFFVFLGVMFKVSTLRQMARTHRIEPMTPEAFSGLSLEQMQQPIRVAPPLPSVVPDESLPKPVKTPSGARDFDWYGIENCTRELQELGFALQSEGALKTDKKASAPAFVRVFKHASGTMAQVFQLFPRGRAPMPVNLSIVTYFEDGWSVGDGTAKGNWASWMLRRKRAIGKRHEATAAALAMWQDHQARRARVASELGVRVTPFSMDDYEANAETELREMRALALRRSALVAMTQARFFRPRNGEWWGDFEREAKKRKTHGDVAVTQNG